MRNTIFSFIAAVMAQGAAADDGVAPLSLDPDPNQIFRVAVEHTGRTTSGGRIFVVTVTLVDAIDGLEPEFSETRYVTYLRTDRAPLVMAGVNDVVSQAVWPFCRELFGGDQFADYSDAVPSSVTNSFTASGACFQAPM